jgi:threonine-phosphate decarboxylase
MIDLGHGANTVDMSIKYNKEEMNILDFSSNINPYLPQNLEKYTVEALKNSTKYPDINYIELKNSISEYLNLDANFIIPGNGASEIIYLLMKCIDGPLGIINPTFSEYERAAKLNNIEIIDLYFENDDFDLNIKQIKEDIGKLKYLFICNPNNPTGKVKYVKELLEIMKSEGKFLIIDETFMEFVHEEENYSLVKYIERFDNLIIIKAITKFFGLPGIRLGYGITSNKKLLEKMYIHKEPWTINSFAENICKYILKDKDYINQSKGYFKQEINYIMEQLKKIPNIKVYSTDTNFILIKLDNIKSGELKKEMFVSKNILIRDASNFKNLDDSYIRIAIKTRKENDLIIKALRETLGGEYEVFRYLPRVMWRICARYAR